MLAAAGGAGAARERPPCRAAARASKHCGATPQLRVGRWAVSKPLVRPIVKPVCGLWAHLLLMQRRSVEVEMVTISGLMQDKRIRCLAKHGVTAGRLRARPAWGRMPASIKCL